MNIHIDRDAGVPAYMQLYAQLRCEITEGAYPYGAKLPSKRLVCAETGVSVITAEHAFAILADEGYVAAKQRSGYFVTYRSADYFPAAQTTQERTAPARELSAEDEAFPYSVLARTMRRVLSAYGEGILVKSPNNGCAELRAAISAYLARSRGIAVSREQVFVGSGAEYLYGLIVALLGRERTYAIESPSYEKIERVYRANGVECDLLMLGTDGVETSELERTSASVLHVTPYNSFPSSVTATASKRAEYMRWAAARGAIIVEDDYYSEFTVSRKIEDTLFSLEPNGTVIYLNTFSKTIAPSIRVGYMVLPQPLADRFRESIGFFSCTVPVFEQLVLAELLQSGDFERHINRVRRRRRRENRG